MNKRTLYALGAITAGLATILTLEFQERFNPSLRSRLAYPLLMLNKPTNPHTIAEVRQHTHRMLSRLRIPPGTGFQPVTAGSVPAEWVTPAQQHSKGVLLYLHGGGYVAGSPAAYRGLVSYLAAAGNIRALSVDYRLAPEHPFPAAVEDATAAYRWLVTNGSAPHDVIIAGDSAGGGLALALLMALRNAGDPLPAGAILLSPWTDLAGTGISIFARDKVDPVLSWAYLDNLAAAYCGDHDRRDPLISPLYGDLSGLPPLLIQAGGKEILLHDATRLADRVIAAGGDAILEVQRDMWHIWQAFGDVLPESRDAINSIGGFIKSNLGEPSPMTGV